MKLACRPVGPGDITTSTWSVKALGTLALEPEGAIAFHRLVMRLERHPHFEHLSRGDLEGALRDFLIPYQAGNRGNRKLPAQEVLDGLARAPMRHRYYFCILHLRLASVIDLRLGRFYPAAQLPRVAETLPEKRQDECGVFCEVAVEGGNTDRMYAQAERSAIEAMSLLRRHVRHALRLGVDQQMLWDIGDFYVVADGARIHCSFRRRPSPLDLTLVDAPWIGRAEQEAREIEALEEPIQRRVLNAFYWLDRASRSMTADVRLPDIFTAMEALLVPEYNGRKAEILTVRAMALELSFGDNFFTPHEILDAYIYRSDLVHGYPVDLGGQEVDRAVDTRMWWAEELLSLYVRLAFSNRAASAERLVAELDNSEAAGRACTWLEREGKTGKEIVQVYRQEIRN